ncbi:hypothetical protein ACIBU0_18810 [Streptomyces sp. NPDC049627]|uniref:hypothetical protein n=1 Tax=Streptomyces sp. NPDC049627 TaxID=3365595 RepID=UPI0037A0D163
MRKPRKTAVVAALLGAVCFLGTGAAHADGHGHKHEHKHGQGHKHGHKRGHAHKADSKEGKTLVVSQSTSCSTTEENIDIQGQYGFQNGREANRSNGEGSPGTQITDIGSTQGCNNTVVLGR